MYSDPEGVDETVNFTMNADFIESIIPVPLFCMPGPQGLLEKWRVSEC